MQRRSQHVDIEELLCTRWYGVVCWLKIAVLAGHFVSRRTQFNDPCSLPGVFVAQWLAVADAGEELGPPLFWQKKKIIIIMEKRRRKKRRQGKRYSQINFVSTSQKNRPPP